VRTNGGVLNINMIKKKEIFLKNNNKKDEQNSLQLIGRYKAGLLYSTPPPPHPHTSLPRQKECVCDE